MIKKIMKNVSLVTWFDNSKVILKLLIMLLLFGTIQSFAATGISDAGIVSSNDLQQKQVTGKITDSDGNGLAGVNILEKGTINGAISDVNGSYAITVASPNSLLTFSFIGFTTQEVIVGALATIDITLHSVLTGLDEIVVVGYSTQARKTLTGAVSTVSSEALSQNSGPSAITRLQGRASGVSIIASHTPGASPTVRIRGMGTINDANPLYVIDGVPGGSYAPDDVESISILKDAAAQAIYGARAANGVVLVTTKSGKRNQKAQVSLEIRQGITQNSNYYRLLNTQEYGEMLWLEAKNTGVSGFSHAQYGSSATPTIPDYISPARASEGDASVDPALYDGVMSHLDGDDTYLIMRANKAGTDWLREADRNAQYKEYNMGITGGSANTTYAFQLGYLKEEGILKWTGYDRYNFRSNITTSPAKWIELGENVGIVVSEDYGHQGDNGESSIISWCYRMQPIVPVLDIDGNYAGTRASSTGNSQNPIFLLDKNQGDRNKNMNLSGNTFVKFNLMPGLSARSQVGITWYGNQSKNFSYVEVAHAERGKYDGLSESASFGLQWTWTNTIEYSKVFASLHDLKVIVGSEAINNMSNNMGGSREEYFSLDPLYMTLNTGLQGINNSGSNSAWSIYSMFGRFNYSFSDKYLLEGVVRRDGSSRFGTNKYGIFPAFSVGWRISEESFMAATSSWIDQLKIRGGYGVLGNDRMGNYNSFTTFAINSNNTFYPMDGSNATLGATGFAQSSFGNEDVKWETTKTANFGFDANLLKKLSLVVDLWQRVTSDMLFPRQIPQVLGRASAPSVNVGEMKNKGFDIEFGYFDNALNGDLKYSIDFVVSHYKNEIVRLSSKETEVLNGSNYREQRYTRTETGRAFPEFFGLICDGIFQTQAEVDEHAVYGSYNKPGHYKFRDINGDNIIDATDRTYIGSPHPLFTAGMNFNVSYKGIGLLGQLYSSVGNDMINYTRRFMDFVQFAGGRSYDRLYNSWGSPYLSDNSQAKLPMAEQDDTRSQVASSAFVEDASYLRLKILRLSYDLNKVLGGKFRNLQVYGQASNLFTLTKYSGLDPELGGAGINMGIDSGAWPTPRQFMFGISLGI